MRAYRDHDHFEDEELAQDDRSLETGSFLTGLVLGAAVGAGVALLFAPASGEQTRRMVRKRARKFNKEARKGFASAQAEARRALREKKEALRERLAEGLERVEEQLGV